MPQVINQRRCRQVVAILLGVCLLPLSVLPMTEAAELHRGAGPEPDALDIHLAQSLSALNVLRDLHEGLIGFDARAELVPGLARQWSVSDDGLQWHFELDEAARWSDGQPITADDVVAGWQRALNPATASPTAGLLDPVHNAIAVRSGQLPAEALGIEAIAPHQLQITLAQPTPWFAELLTHPVTYPWSGEVGARYSGAFSLAERRPGSHIRLVANPHFRAADTVQLAAVTWHLIEEPNVELSRYRAGQLHITETIPPGRLDWMREQFGDQLRIAPYLGSFFLSFNLNRPPFAENPGLREALSLVIDRPLLVERVLGTGEVPASGLIPPGMPGWPDQPAPVASPDEAAVARARMLYEAAGYGRHRPLQVEVRFNTSLTHRRMAAAVAAMWRQHLGVETRLVNEEWKVFVANRRQGRITEVVRGGWIADWRDAGNFLQLFMADSPLNYTFFNDPTFEFLMDSASEQYGAQRLRTLRLAEAHLLDEHAILPLYYYVSRHLVHPAVRGFEDNAMDIHLSRWISLE